MNKLKKALVSVGVAAAVLVGGGVADVATSHNTAQAQAYTDYGWKYVWNCMPYPSAALQWRDYNWWEEMWGQTDKWVFHHYIYRYC